MRLANASPVARLVNVCWVLRSFLAFINPTLPSCTFSCSRSWRTSARLAFPSPFLGTAPFAADESASSLT
eukprot:9383876-Alexandrium_andersonii.AAC.1